MVQIISAFKCSEANYESHAFNFKTEWKELFNGDSCVQVPVSSAFHMWIHLMFTE